MSKLYTYTTTSGSDLVLVHHVNGTFVGWVNGKTGKFKSVVTEAEADEMLKAALMRGRKK